jgi:hypothetical protein
MSSWCDLSVDGFMVHGSQSYIDDVMLSVFQERDRRVRPDARNEEAEEQYFHYQNAIPAQAMRERLDTLGFTVERARADYAGGHAEQVELVDAEVLLSGADLEKLRRRTYEYWRAAIGRLVPQGFHAMDRSTWREIRAGCLLFRYSPAAAWCARCAAGRCRSRSELLRPGGRVLCRGRADLHRGEAEVGGGSLSRLRQSGVSGARQAPSLHPFIRNRRSSAATRLPAGLRALPSRLPHPAARPY